jgi:hypothetical protein
MGTYVEKPIQQTQQDRNIPIENAEMFRERWLWIKSLDCFVQKKDKKFTTAITINIQRPKRN